MPIANRQTGDRIRTRPAPKIHSPGVIAHIIDEGDGQFHLLLDDRSERDIEPHRAGLAGIG